MLRFFRGTRAFQHGLTLRSVRTMCSAPRESMDYDVVVVGAGPAGLSAAIKLKQIAAVAGTEISVCVVEKGAEVGSHTLSGNVFEPRALNELIPDWKEKGAPLTQPVTHDAFFYLSKRREFKLPNFMLPPSLDNHGNYIISLGSLCKWLGEQATDLGVEIYPGFAASEVLYGEKGQVEGIATKDAGIGKDGKPKDTFQRGMELRGKQTLFAEGARGSLSEEVMAKFQLRKDCDPQTYGLGIKEIWTVPEKQCYPGYVQHTLGWPIQDMHTWGGTFMYHQAPNKIFIGMVIGLDYANPYLSPYQEFQRWKHHPHIAKVLKGGQCVSYGARVINEGGVQAIPKLTFPGGALLGCSAGFLNVPKIKGSHLAIKSGIVAAEAIMATKAMRALEGAEITQYSTSLKASWAWSELESVRNIHPSFQKWGYPGLIFYGGLDQFLLKGRGATLRNHTPDVEKTKLAKDCKQIQYPKPDGVLSFDLLTNLQRSGTNHNHDQPPHLQIKPELKDAPTKISFEQYAGPEQRFCPAKVYEFDDKGTLTINAQNCVHCKTCDIKTPANYIKWTVPEGGGGPAYENM